MNLRLYLHSAIFVAVFRQSSLTRKTKFYMKTIDHVQNYFFYMPLISENQFIFPFFLSWLHHFYFSISILLLLLKQHYIHLQPYSTRCSDSLGTSESIFDERYSWFKAHSRTCFCFRSSSLAEICPILLKFSEKMYPMVGTSQ